MIRRSSASSQPTVELTVRRPRITMHEKRCWCGREMLLEPNEMISASQGSRRRRTFWLRWYDTSPSEAGVPADEPAFDHSLGELIAQPQVSAASEVNGLNNALGVKDDIPALPPLNRPVALTPGRRTNGATSTHAVLNDVTALVGENGERRPKSVVDCLSELAAILEATPHPERERCLRLVRHCQQAVHGSARANRPERPVRRPR